MILMGANLSLFLQAISEPNSHCKLEELDLSTNPPEIGGLSCLENFGSQNSTIHSFTFRCCGLTAISVPSMLAFVEKSLSKRDPILKSLVLGGVDTKVKTRTRENRHLDYETKMENKVLTTQFLRKLGETLKHYGGLTSFDVSGGWLVGREAPAVLAKLISSAPSLQIVKVGKFKYTYKEGLKLAEALKSLPNLIELEIAMIPMVSIGELVANSKVLSRLTLTDLKANQLESFIDLTPLVAGAKKCPSLISVQLSGSSTDLEKFYLRALLQILSGATPETRTLIRESRFPRTSFYADDPENKNIVQSPGPKHPAKGRQQQW